MTNTRRIVLCLTTAVLAACQPPPGATAPANDPCAGAVAECIDLAKTADRRYDEAAIHALEMRQVALNLDRPYCSAMLATPPLATAASTADAAKAVQRLVLVCYEKGRIPLSETMACNNERESADRGAAAAIERYSSVLTPLMSSMTPEQGFAYMRATNAALDGKMPFGPDHECMQQGHSQEPTTQAR